ncbi:hypothetical protein B0J14DRAFT_648769 [Halenospora varia]|nr:hypothetical protein B0J14DRAFT_648769 [Halenospora varia]
MKYSAITTLLLAAAPFLVNAGVVSLDSRASAQENQAGYDAETQYMINNSQCRSFVKPSKANHNEALSTCLQKCSQSPKNDPSVGVLSSTSCVWTSKDSGLTYSGPNKLGDYRYGKCMCNIPILDQTIGIVVMALPAIGEIACSVLFSAFDKVIEVGLLAIPGEGEINASIEAGVKAAKTILENGEKASSFAKWFNPCGPKVPGAHDYAADATQLWDSFTSIPDSRVQGCGKGPKAQGKCK